jgi:hypothetical protein
MISVMREIWLEAWLTRYGLRVWMARFNDWKGLVLQDYNEVIEPYAWYKQGWSLDMTHVDKFT